MKEATNKAFKTFKDLEFKPHKVGTGLASYIIFKNGYGVSVVRFKLDGFTDSYFGGSYTYGPNEWELAVLKKRGKSWDLCYTTPITDDVIGHLKPRQVTHIMKRVQLLKAHKK